MSTGKILAALIVVCALLAGGALYYLQVYYYYDEVTPEMRMSAVDTGAPVGIDTANLRAIDADSSPIRFRACFSLTEPLGDLATRFVPYPRAEPLTAPGWFDCFDATAIGADLEAGRATAYLGEENIHYGIDRVIAVEPDGRAFAWHQINACGEKVFNGDPAPDSCPPAPERTK